MTPPPTRPGAAQRLYGRRGKPEGVAPGNNNHQQGNLNQALPSPPPPMIDGSTSSGTDTSDTESDAGSGVYARPLMYGNPAAAAVHSGNANAAKASPLCNRRKFSFGSLQLEEGEGLEDEEEEEEEGCYRFTEEEVGGRVFSC